MRKILLSFLMLAGCAWGAVAITPIQPVFLLEDDHVVFFWITDLASTTKVKWYVQGADPGTAVVMTAAGTLATSTIHKGVVSTLTNGVTYEMIGCSALTSGDTAEVCSTTPTVIAVPAAVDTLSVPVLPDTAWQTSAESHPNGIKNKPVLINELVWNFVDGSGSATDQTNSVINIGPDCLVSDAGATNGKRMDEVNAAMTKLTGSRNIEVRIDPDCTYVGRQRFPARNVGGGHSGWVTYTSTGNIPPPGVRATTDWEAQMPTFINNNMWGSYNQGTNVVVLTSDIVHNCAEGDRAHFYSTAGAGSSYQGVCTAYHTGTADTAVNITAFDDTTKVFTVDAPHTYAVNDIINFTVVAGINYSLTGTTINSGTFRIASIPTATTFTLTETVTGTLGGGTNTTQQFGNWIYVPYVGGPSGDVLANRPATCTIGQIFRQTDFPASGANATYNTNIGSGSSSRTGLWYCFITNTWTQWNVLDNAGTALYSHLHFPTDAHRYRFEGIKLTRHQGYSSATAGQMQGMQWNYTANTIEVGQYITDGRTNDIVFDRVVFQGIGGVTRVGRFSLFNGSRNAIINSSLHNIRRPLAQTGSFPYSSNAFGGQSIAFGLGSGPGPYLYENNYVDTVGISIYDDSSTTVVGQADGVVIRRNYMTKPVLAMPGATIATHGADSDGYFYQNRHHLEQKRGKRYLVTGNQFYRNFAAEGPAQNIQGMVWAAATTNSGATTGPGAERFTIHASTPADDITITTTATLSANVLNGANTGRLKIYVYGSTQHDGLYTVTSAAGSVFTISPACVGCSSTGGTIQVVQAPSDISDMTFRYNYIQGAGSGIYLGTLPAQGSGVTSHAARRISITNNVFDNISSKFIEDGGYHADKGGLYTGCNSNPCAAYGFELTRGQGGSTDVTFKNNILHNFSVGSQGTANMIHSDATAWNDQLLGRRHTYTKNIMHSTQTYASGLRGKTDGVSSEMLDSLSVVRDNVFCCALSSAAVDAIPSGANASIANTSTLAFYNESFANFRRKAFVSGVANSYRSYGPDYNAMEAEMGLVKNARVTSRTTSGATVSYYAPDGENITVEYGTSAAWGSGARISDAAYHGTYPNDRVRNVPITGLASATEYHYRILGAVEQPSGTFWTR